MRIKKIMTGAVVVAAALVLAGCGTPTTTPSTPTSSAPPEPVKLEMSWWGDAKRAALFDQVLTLFESKYPNITVQRTPVGSPDDLFNRLATDFASGGTTAPDVFALGGAKPQEYGAAGQLLDLASVKDIVQSDKYPQMSLTNGIVGGKLYALPTGGNATAMYVNTDILAKAGVTAPTGKWSWTDLVTIANKVGSAKLTTADGKPIYGLDLRVQDILGTYCGQLSEYGMYTPDGKLGITAADIASWYKIELQLRDGGGLPDPTVVTSNWNLTPDQTPYALGQAAITFGYSNLIATYAKGGTTVIQAPPTNTARSGVALLPSAFWAINANTKHPTEAAQLVNWFLNEPDAAKLILDTRGVQFNPDIATVVAQNVTGDSAKADAYVASVLASGKVAPPQPNGGANMNQYSQDKESDVLFGKSTPEVAAQQWVDQLSADLVAAK